MTKSENLHEIARNIKHYTPQRISEVLDNTACKLYALEQSVQNYKESTKAKEALITELKKQQSLPDMIKLNETILEGFISYYAQEARPGLVPLSSSEITYVYRNNGTVKAKAQSMTASIMQMVSNWVIGKESC